MTPEKLLALHSENKQKELLCRLKTETSKHFFERSACDINDALTSILAVSDTEAPKTVPKVKKYIQRVNESLQSLKIYQSAFSQKSAFDVNAVVNNVLNVVEESLEEKIVVTRNITETKTLVSGDQSELEEFLLYLFIQLAESGTEKKSYFEIELRQKDQSVIITILNDSVVPEAASRDIGGKAGNLKDRVQIVRRSAGTEFTIVMPLIFSRAFFVQPQEAASTRISSWINRKKEEKAVRV